MNERAARAAAAVPPDISESQSDGARAAQDMARAVATIENLRETAKWIAGGVAATAAGIIAGSPLTGIGSLDPSGRLLLAIAGALVGFGFLGGVLWAAIDVIAARAIHLYDLRDAKPATSKLRVFVEREYPHLFPKGVKTFAELDTLLKAKDKEFDEADDDAKNRLLPSMRWLGTRTDGLLRAAWVEDTRLAFGKLRNRTFLYAVPIILGFGVFAWAANPRKEEFQAVAKPYTVLLTLSSEELEYLKRSVLDPKCAPVAATLRVTVIATKPLGLVEVVTPADGNCEPVRLLIRDADKRIISAG